MELSYCCMESLGKGLLTNYEIDACDFALARNICNSLFAIGMTRYKGLSFRRDQLFFKNWKILAFNGVTGTIAIVLANYAYFLLPLTIWYVLLCTLPFMLAILSFFVYGEKMGLGSIFAAILSFAAIVVLTLANSVSDDDNQSWNYVLGIICSLICMLCISGYLLSVNRMQNIDSFLVMKSANLFSVAIIGFYVLVRWPITG